MRTVWLRPRVDLLGPAAAAGLLAALLVWLGPREPDLAAHVYQRTLFIEHGFVLWNNFWYAGRYSFVNYSVLYYPAAAAIGIKLLAVLTRDGRSGRVLRCRAPRVGVAQPVDDPGVRSSSGRLLVVSAAYPFMLGMALALLALWSLQHDRRWVFACLTLLTLAASPLAFLLLVVLLWQLWRSPRPRRASPVRRACRGHRLDRSARVPDAAHVPGRGSYPFSPRNSSPRARSVSLGVALTWRVAGARLLRWTYVVYFVACTAAFAISSPVGENIARLRFRRRPARDPDAFAPALAAALPLRRRV